MQTSTFMRSRRGAAFLTTLVFTALLLALSAAILTWSTTESRLNNAHQNRMMALNAAEALNEYGAAIGSRQVQEVTEYSPSFMSPSDANMTPALPAPEMAEFFAGTNIDPSMVEIVGKIAPVNSAGGFDVNAADLSNTYSSLRGLRGRDGRLTVLSRASTLPDAVGRRQTIYLSKTYTVLDAPVLQFAAFYNMDLEIAPGPAFNIYGPVHTNADLWVSKQSSSSVNLNFWEAVTAYGKIQKGFKVQPITATGGREVTSNDPIRFMTPAGTFVNLFGSYGSFTNVWRDHLMGTTTDHAGDFRQFCNDTFGNATTPSYLQTSAHGVQRRRLPGQLDNYIADPNPTDAIIHPDYRNVPRALIERPLRTGDFEFIGNEVEMQKMSRKAGLYIIVNPTGLAKPLVRAPNGMTIALASGEYRAYVRDPASTVAVPIYREVKLPGQPRTLNNMVGTHPYVVANSGNPLIARDIDVRPLVLVRPNQMVDMRRFLARTAAVPAGFDYLQPRAAGNVYQPKRINLIEIDMSVLRLAVDTTVNGLAQTMMFPYDSNWGQNTPNFPAPGPGISNNQDPNYRSAYRAAPNNNLADFGITTGGAGINRREGLYTHLDNRYLIAGMNPTDWDGSIYIESVDADFINVADLDNPAPSGGVTWLRRRHGYRNLISPNTDGNSGVRLINGRGPIVSAGATRLANTAIPCSPGLTLSTNDALYVLGHLNANGVVVNSGAVPTQAQFNDINITDENSSGGNSSLFRDPIIRNGAPMEQPLALVADSVTILSQPTFNPVGSADGILDNAQTGGWNDSLSHIANSSANWSVNWRTTVASNSNQRDGWYIAPPAGQKRVLDTVANVVARSPLEIYISNDLVPYPPSDELVATADTRPSIDVKFPGAETEISAGFIVGLTPSANNITDPTFVSSTGDGNNSGGLHNLPRFLENWGAICAIRGSMVVMFESQIGWEPWSLRMYGPPTRFWGFHNYFRNFVFSDDVPATRSVGRTNRDEFQLLSRGNYILQRAALWPSYSFPAPPL